MISFTWWFSWNSTNNWGRRKNALALFIKHFSVFCIWYGNEWEANEHHCHWCLLLYYHAVFFRIQLLFFIFVNNSHCFYFHIDPFLSLLCSCFLCAIQMKSMALFIAKDCKDTQCIGTLTISSSLWTCAHPYISKLAIIAHVEDT